MAKKKASKVAPDDFLLNLRKALRQTAWRRGLVVGQLPHGGSFRLEIDRRNSPKILSVTLNPHAMPGKPLYNRFMKEFMTAADKTLLVCMHGTNVINIPSIMKNGLLPERRRQQVYGTGEYFSTNVENSLHYNRNTTRQMKRMCMFVVLNGWTHKHYNDEVLVNPKPETQLPIAIVKFKK